MLILVETDADNVDPYNSDEKMVGEYDSEEAEACDSDVECAAAHGRRKSYEVLSPDDIRRRLEEDVAEVSTVLSVSSAVAVVLLLKYKWVIGNVQEAWFEDEERVRATVGLVEDAEEGARRKVARVSSDCGICLENFDCGEMKCAACGHRFCGSCWKRYVSASIDRGPGCLTMRCPEPSCGAAVGRDMVEELVSEEHKYMYLNYLLMSYVENKSNRIKWCPAPNCFYAVETVLLSNGDSSGSYDVTCNLTYSFCWSCSNEAHSPVDCDVVGKWILKNTNESETATWILANTIACPKCKRRIEKAQCFKDVRCPEPCGFSFCWMCLAEWTDFDHKCNSFDRDTEGEKKKRSLDKESLDRYTYYFGRWAANEASRDKAVVELQLFEYLQVQAEEGLERLQVQAEEVGRVPLAFDAFRAELTNLTEVTRKYFKNLVRALENGLVDVTQSVDEDECC